MDSTKKHFSVWRLTKRIFLWIGLLVLVLVGTSTAIVTLYKDDVIKYASEKLNDNLNAAVSFESVDLTILKTFPYASLEFKDVVSKSYYKGKETPDTLFRASYLYFQFNIRDLFLGNYSVRRITLRDADLNLFVDEKGNNNWQIWKGNDKASKNDKFSFNISAVKLNKVHVLYSDLRSNGLIDANVKNLLLSGNFSEVNHRVNIESEMSVNELKWGETNLPYAVDLKLDAKLQVNSNDKTYKISSAGLTFNKMSVNCEGSLAETDGGLYADLVFNGNRLDVSEVLNLIPGQLTTFREEYDGDGIIDLSGSVKGFVSRGKQPDVSVIFSGNDVSFLAHRQKVKLSGVNFNGSFHYFPAQPQNNRLEFTTISGKLPSSDFSGKFSLANFATPEINFVVNARIELSELFSFFSVDTLEKISGRMDADISFSATMSGGKRFDVADLQKAKVKGSLQLHNVELRVKNSLFGFEETSGYLEFDNSYVHVRDFAGRLAGNDFKLNGDAINLLPYIFVPQQQLTIRADLECRSLDAARFTGRESKSSTEASPLILPDFVSLDLDARIGKFTYKRFEASNIRGKINLYNKALSVEGVRMETLGGNIFLNGLADNRGGNGFKIACNGNLNGVSLGDFFYRFENFGQKSVSNEHLKGKLDAFVEFKADFSPELKASLPSIYLRTDLEINNGELVRFEPLKALAGWVRLEELEHIRFAKLKNTIYIKDQKIIIPAMSVYSNALDITIAGEHGFDNRVDYSFSLFLGDILANKFRLKPRKDKQGEFGELIPDKGRTKLFVRMYGPMDNLSFSYDRSAVKEKLAQDIQAEKINVKNLLDAEFGVIKNDSILKSDAYLKEKSEKREKRRKAAQGSDEFEFE